MSREFWNAQRSALFGTSSTTLTSSQPPPLTRLSQPLLEESQQGSVVQTPWRPPVAPPHSRRGVGDGLVQVLGASRAASSATHVAGSTVSTSFPLWRSGPLHTAAASLLKDLKSREGVPSEALEQLRQELQRCTEEQFENGKAVKRLSELLEAMQSETQETRQRIEAILSSVERLVQNEKENEAKLDETAESEPAKRVEAVEDVLTEAPVLTDQYGRVYPFHGQPVAQITTPLQQRSIATERRKRRSSMSEESRVVTAALERHRERRKYRKPTEHRPLEENSKDDGWRARVTSWLEQNDI